MKTYFYKKENREISAVNDIDINKKAKKRLAEIYNNRIELGIPDALISNWDNVALYDPSGSVENALSIVVKPIEGGYHLKNKLNDLTGKEWIKFTCSWFIFNALKEDLKQEKAIDATMEQHPATYSPTMIAEFIKFFTKKGQTVLDPFCGIGSTLEACRRTERIGYGIELNPKYYNFILKRTPEFKQNIFNDDCLNIDELNISGIDFCISSPPYWDILNRSTHNFKSDREKKNLDINYSESIKDLGNIDDYNLFIDKLKELYLKIYEILNPNAYVVIIIKNVKKGGKLYPIAWDIAKALSDKYVLKDEKIWIQDKVGLAPYGYPYSWTSNILHHYCIILRKEV
jgi:DNA modification methylase